MDMDSKKTLNDYSQQSTSAVIEMLSSSKEGISSRDAKGRLEKFGLNVLSQKKDRTILFEFLSNFKSPLVIVLLFAAIISFFLASISTDR